MSKLILSASLLLILEISIAQTANDKTKLIIAPYSICLNGLVEKDSLTLDELLTAGGIECCFAGLKVISFTMGSGGNCLGPQGMYLESASKTDQFTEQMIRIFKLYPKGYPIWFDNVIVKNMKGETFLLKTKTIFIIANPMKESS